MVKQESLSCDGACHIECDVPHSQAALKRAVMLEPQEDEDEDDEGPAYTLERTPTMMADETLQGMDEDGVRRVSFRCLQCLALF